MDYRDFELQISKEGPDQYRASALKDGEAVASQIFELRTGGVRLYLGLEQLEKGAIGPKSKETFHIDFGQELYGKVFSGELGDYFRERFEEALDEGSGLRISLRFSADAAEIAALPWEFLHDGEDFLVTKRDLLISRLPAEVRRRKSEPLETTLRMLVVVSSPNDPNIAPLNTVLEQEVILEAADRLQQENKMEVDFSEDATYDTVQGYLNEKEYQIFHFTGHGSYHDDRGHLIFEKEDGTAREIDNRAVADLLAGRGVRLVVLSACQSGKASNKEAYADLASFLAKEGIPAVVAMQYSIFDLSATNFASAFYRPLASNKPVDLALTEARVAMKNAEKSNGVDFATPLLYLNDPACLNLGEIRPETTEIVTRPEMLGELQVMKKGFVGRQRELRILQKAFSSDVKRAAIIYGFGGIGKTVLATRLALRMNKYFAGVFGTKCKKTTAPEEILNELNAFLMMDGVDQLNRVIHAQVPLNNKVQVLVSILNQHRYLMIFDNFEDCLDEEDKIGNPDLRGFVQQLLNGIYSNTKIIFTTRHNFDPLDGRLIGAIERISLPELPFPQTVWLMTNHRELANLDTKKKFEIYEAIGGNPWTIGQFAVHAIAESVDGLLLELAPLKRKMVEFTLLDKSYSKLNDEDKRLLLCASVYEEAVPVEALSWIAGDERHPSPPVGDTLKKLLNWGLLAMQEGPGRELYSIHTLVKDFARKEAENEVGFDINEVLIRAARFYENQFQATGNLWYYLKARSYYYQAEEWERADDIVNAVTYYLIMWGNIELAINLLDQSVKTTTSTRKAVALGNLATIYHRLGDLKIASKLYGEVKEIFEQEGKRKNLASIFHQQGMLAQQTGEIDEARRLFDESLTIRQELDDKRGIAMSLHQLGVLAKDIGEVDEALRFYGESLKIEQELGNKRGVAYTLGQLGNLYKDQGNCKKAVELYQQCLDISEELGDKSSIGKALFQLGTLSQEAGEIDMARRLYSKSLKIAQELGDKSDVAISLHVLGNMAYLQGEIDEARRLYGDSLKIHQKLGDRRRIAELLARLGRVSEEQDGDYVSALENYLLAQSIFNELNDPRENLAESDVSRLREKMGEEAFEKALEEIRGRHGA